MSDGYEQLRAALIGHLETLKRSGQSVVHVRTETLNSLAQPKAVGFRRSPVRPEPPVVQPPAGPSTAPIRPVAHDLSVPVSTSPTPDPAVRGALEFAVASTSPIDKHAAMEELRNRALVCLKCRHLAGSRKNVVFGVGDINTPLMFVGEAPGADEDAAGEPFVGKAGQLLTRIIETMGFTRDTVYIANILKCRPDTPGQAYGNRKPTPDEMKTCLPYLLAQINLIQPRIIVALGATALEGLFGNATSISRVRGTWLSFQGVPVMPTFHPAYLLRSPALSEKRKVWEDMLQVLDRLGVEINERQRNYFLTPPSARSLTPVIEEGTEPASARET
jgi:uracil-DNA glycosylase family 4